MNKYRLNVVADLQRVIFVIGLSIIALAVFFYLPKSAEMQSDSKLSEQNLVLGRLAHSQKTLRALPFPHVAFEVVRTADSQGTGQITLTGFPPSASEPTWSPDGTKIAFVAFNASSDIYVMNANGSGQTFLTNTMTANERNPSWSVNGKIAYERDGQIWVMNADGTNQIQFSGISQPSPTSPAWSPNGTKLAFSSGGEIWVINSDGTNEQRVTMNATTDADPAWSPDGSKIVFAKGGLGIAVINSDGTNEMNLTNGTNDQKPSWSPDGTTIAFVRSGAGIYIMDVNGANQVRIIADQPVGIGIDGTRNNDPEWQPIAQTPNTFTISGRITREGANLSGAIVNLSGSTNAATTTDAVGNYQFSNLSTGGNFTISPSFVNHFFTPANRIFNNLSSNQIADFAAVEVCTTANCVKNGKIAFARGSGIWTMSTDGTNQTNITNGTSPNYSPDGSNIIFSTNRDGNNEIYRMNVDGSNPLRLTNNTASETSPNYSPDGASIVFVSNRDGNGEIYKMNADGTNQVRLTTNTTADDVPTYSPDGSKIIFVRNVSTGFNGNIWTMNSNGTNQQILNTAVGFYNRPSYSPDGAKIILVYDGGVDITAQDIWTMNADGTNLVRFPVGRSSPSYSPDGAKVVHTCCFNIDAGMDGIRVNGTILTLGGGDTLPDWQPILAPRRVPFDFDGDGRSDISVFRPADRIWYLLRSQGGFTALQWGLATDTLVPADYDGDLKIDIAVWRSSDRNFYIFNSFNNTVRIENFGLSGDVPTGGDFDGDGKADLAVYRGGAQGIFYYRGSSGNPNGNITIIPWGISGDKPVAGDFDGDGKTDAAIFRPSSGVWYVRQSTDGQLLANAFGLANDTLVPADYDADGKTDLAVYRDGIWYILRSLQGFTAFQYGLSNDVPAPADYDGDGRADAAVYRNGIWWILKTQSGTTEVVSFGLGGDKPIPAAYVR